MNKITDTELKRVQSIKNDALEIASTLGELEYQKITIELLIEDQKSKIKELQKYEKELFQELIDKYGNININSNTGEYQ